MLIPTYVNVKNFCWDQEIDGKVKRDEEKQGKKKKDERRKNDAWTATAE